MRSHERETAFLVLRNCVRGRLKSRDRVAPFALVFIRPGGELPVMGVLVTIQTLKESNFIARRGSRRNVAPRAGHGGVLTCQWIRGSRVFLHTENRRFPSIDCVTRGAFALVLSRRKLPAMGIGVMAICAHCECHRLLEVG